MKYRLNFCQKLIAAYDYFHRLSRRLDNFIDKYLSWMMPHYVSRDDRKEGIKQLGYDDNNIFSYHDHDLSDPSKCYVMLLSPLLVVVTLALFHAFYGMLFEKNTILLTRNIVELIPLVIPFLLVFVGILPYLFFKFVRLEGKKNASVYLYGVIIALFFPLLVIPQIDFLRHAKPFSFEGTVIKKNVSRKNRDLVLQTNLSPKRLTLRDVDETTLRLAHKGDRYTVLSRRSRYYLQWDRLIPIQETK